MKATELRIGNWVNEKEKVKNMHSISNHNAKDYSNFKPIPITEDWLIELGFNKDCNEFRSKRMIGINDSVYQFILRLNEGCCDLVINEHQINIDEHEVVLPVFIKHVHQLQNLYFALTGEELTIKI